MNKQEGVVQGFNATGKTAIVDGVSYGCYDPSHWKEIGLDSNG